jgi:hypothetical protein
MRWWLPVLVALVFGGSLVAYVIEQDTNNDLLCEAVNANRATMRNLLVSARNQTPERRLNKRARRFYREQIAAVRPLHCGNFNRESLHRQQERAQRKARGGDASARAQTQQPP